MSSPTMTPRRAADIIYDSLYSGAVGAAFIALFFLASDAMTGDPLQTPSLMGSSLFLGELPSEATAVRLDMIAYYTIVHILAFAGLGTIIALMMQVRESICRSLSQISAVLFVLLTGGIFVAAPFFADGTFAAVGWIRILLANLLTALVMGTFLWRAHLRALAEG